MRISGLALCPGSHFLQIGRNGRHHGTSFTITLPLT
jgi:hypothetical protein